MSTPIVIDIVEEARHNPFFRRVVHTGALSQLVVMTIPAFEEIGEETHRIVEQSLFIVDGEGTMMLDGQQEDVHAGDAIIVTPGTRHNLRAGRQPLRLFTIYTPPNHIDGIIHRTRAEAEADVEDEDFGRQIESRRR